MTSKPMSGTNAFTFTWSDFISGINRGYLLNLIDDVKIRDGSCKAIQYAFKLTAACLKEATPVQNNAAIAAIAVGKTTVPDTSPANAAPIDYLAWSKALDQAAGSISLARRCFRFLRWTRTVDDLSGILKSDGTNIVGILKRINWMGSMTAMLVEDITTVGRLGLVDKARTEAWSEIGNWGWFIESVTGFAIQVSVVNQTQSEFYQARKAVREAGGAVTPALVLKAYIAYTKYALARVLFLKWISETIASSHDMGYHRYTKTSMLFSFISACCTVLLQAAKTWPGRY